jgi:hypothetical protein
MRLAESDAGFWQRMATGCRVLGHRWDALGEHDLAELYERTAVMYQVMVDQSQETPIFGGKQ